MSEVSSRSSYIVEHIVELSKAIDVDVREVIDFKLLICIHAYQKMGPW